MKKLRFIDRDCLQKLWLRAGIPDISTEQQLSSDPASHLSEKKQEIQTLGYLNCFCANQKVLNVEEKKVSHATLFPLFRKVVQE